MDAVGIHTDGGCVGNPGPGGYGAILIYKNARKELFGGFRSTTNNRMELIAAIVGLEALNRECRVVLHTDSEHLAKGMEKGWAKKWRENGWRTSKKKEVANVDLRRRLLDTASRHEIRFAWTKGHAGDAENERCHRLASRVMRKERLPADEGYERE